MSAASTVATGQSGHRDELVDGRPAVDDLPSEPPRDRADISQGRRDVRADPRLGQPVRQAEVGDELRDPGDDPGPVGELAQERQAAGGRRGIDGPRDEEAVAALLERPRGRDERTAAGGRLDHDRRVGEAADDPVPPRERADARARVGRQLRDDRAARGDDRIGQAGMCARVEHRVARADDRDGRAVGVDRGGMRGAVDADRETGDDARPDLDEARRDPCRGGPSGVRRPARPDDGDGRIGAQRGRVAEDVQQVWRHLDRSRGGRDRPDPRS